MKRPHHALVILLSISLSTVTDAAKAGPFRDFFRTLRSAIANPKETPRPHRSAHKRKKTAPSDASNSQTSDKPTPMPGGRTDVRWARAASSESDQKADLPYGTTVPGKPGFVTSPFAPDAGYVQVLRFSTANSSRRSLHRQNFPYAISIAHVTSAVLLLGANRRLHSFGLEFWGIVL